MWIHPRESCPRTLSLPHTPSSRVCLGWACTNHPPHPTPTFLHQVMLGWAWTDRQSYAAFMEEANAAPPGLRPVLQQLAMLYGLSRLEAGVECYLSTGGCHPGLAVLRTSASRRFCCCCYCCSSF